MRGNRVFHASKIVGDGKVHEIRADLRDLKLNTTLNTLALGVSLGSGGSATFDLLDLTFAEPVPRTAVQD